MPCAGLLGREERLEHAARVAAVHADARCRSPRATTYGPGWSPGARRASSGVDDRRRACRTVSRRRRAGIASRALTTRFITTCSSWPGSARTAARLAARARSRSSMSSPMSRREHRRPRSLTTSLRSSTSRPQHLPPAEGQELPGRARRRGRRRCVICSDVRARRRSSSGSVGEEELGVADDRRSAGC